MKYLKFSKDFITSTLAVLKPEEGTLLVVKSGQIMIRYKNDVTVCVKSPLAFFDGAFPSERFWGISKIDKDYFLFAVTKEGQFKIRSGSLHVWLNMYSTDYDGIEVNLWDAAIKWHAYTQDLIDGINLVADIAVRLPEEADQEAFSGIHIVGDYVTAADDNFWRVSRYRLSSSMPFNITLPPRDIKNVFRQLSGRKLRRIAEVETVDNGKVSKGMAFDFGDVRVWIPRVEVQEQNTCDDMERGGGFITFGRNYVVSGANMILNTPCEFIITISSALREKIPIAIKDGDGKTSPLAITFKKGKIHFLYRNENFSSKGNVLIKDCMPEHPVIARADYNHFVQALRGKRLIGLIQFRGNKFLYFKSKKLEHFIKAQ